MSASLRPYLKTQNLFCRDINRDVSPAVVKAYLEKLCPHGKIVLPIDHNNPGRHIGQAYLNFNSYDEATRVLNKHRFSIDFKGQPAKLMYAAVDKDRVYGPYSLKFQIIVKNLSEQVDVGMLFDFFSEFGEIYQCKTDTDVFGQYFGQVTYMDEESVQVAVDGANQTRWQSSVIVVEPHHRAHLAQQAGSSSAPPPDAGSAMDFPALGASSSGAAAASSYATLQQQQQQAAAAAAKQQMQRQQQQQQQHREEVEQGLFSGAVNFALQDTSSVPLPPPFSAAMAPPPGSPAALSNGTFSPLDSAVHLAYGGSSSGGGGVGVPVGLGVSGGVGADVQPLPSRLGMPGHLLHLLDRRRAESAGTACTGSDGGLSPAGDQPVSRLAFAGHHLGGAAAVGTPTSTAVGTAASTAAVGGRGTSKGGILKGVAGVLRALEQVSEVLCCPITHEPFKDPVVAADGVTYERSAIMNWLSKSNTSPMSNTVLPNLHLHPNNLVKTLVEELL